MTTRRPNTSNWQFVEQSGRARFGKSWRRGLERILGIGPGQLRSVIDADMPDAEVAEIERRIAAAFADQRLAARDALVDAINSDRDINAVIAQRRAERDRIRPGRDPDENTLFAELVDMTPWFDDAERRAMRSIYVPQKEENNTCR